MTWMRTKTVWRCGVPSKRSMDVPPTVCAAPVGSTRQGIPSALHCFGLPFFFPILFVLYASPLFSLPLSPCSAFCMIFCGVGARGVSAS